MSSLSNSSVGKCYTMPSREVFSYHQVGPIKMNYMGSKSDSLTRHDPYIATSGDVTTATTSATTTTATTTSTKKTVLVAFYFFICSIPLRWDFARNSEADISKRELSLRNGHRITVLAPCTLPVCMHLCAHIAYNMGANSPYTHKSIKGSM